MKSILKTIVSLLVLFLVSCDPTREQAQELNSDTKPPVAALEAALKEQYSIVDKYTVTNRYTRQVQDEQFYIVEATVDYTYVSYSTKESFTPKRETTPKKARVALGFVQRGNSWRYRVWQD